MSSRQNFDYVEWHAWYSDTQKSYQSDISYQSDMKMNKQTHKKIISYKHNRHRSHENSIPSKHFIEYNSYSSLFKIINNFKKNNKSFSYKNKYKKYSKNKVMNNFNNFFLKNKNSVEFSFIDYIKNYINFFKMYYFYLRHKIYTHYFHYIEIKLIDKII